jgi:hypothetical protein
MKCVSHPEIDAVSTCVRCGSGICQNCTLGTQYQIGNKPLCTKCNYEIGLENDHIFKTVLNQKKIKLIIFSITFVFGLAAFIANQVKGKGIAMAIIAMLFFWGFGFIGNFFDKTPDTRSVKSQTKDALHEIQYPMSTLVGKIIGFFIMALTSPIQIAACLIGIGKVQKQITENTAILNGFVTENTQQ